VVKIFGLGILVLSLFGCIKQLEPNDVELTGPKQASRTAPNCAGCHKFPLNDVNHHFHFFIAGGVGAVDAEKHPLLKPTCMDCHYGSIGHQVYGVLDGTPPGAIPLPWGWDGENIDKDSLNFKIDSAAKIGQVLEWMTGKKHMNKRVDVEFPPSIVPDSVLRDSAYSPTDYSCSNIGCHGEPAKKYRWANKSKGLSFMNGSTAE
jgi:hypothetical protein